MPLELMGPGERGEITQVRHCGGCGGGCHDSENRHKPSATRAEELGLRTGKTVEMLKNDGNLLLLLVDETRIAIDRRMARGISVKGIGI